ncbi:MAG: hypothetical protein LBU14_03620 [Candidatus Peribacteria bacterium]|nr:hypothetical protein [Candidatus Peribacteria bacterium]
MYLADENEFKDGDKAEIEKNCKITTDELFQVYKTRQAKFGEKLNSPQIKDIFVNSSCFSGNFIRNFYLKCDSEKISKPIFIGSSEY